MAAKAEIVFSKTIKPSSPTPNHLRDLKISLLDQLAPPSFYVPIVLFYSASDFKTFGTDSFTQISDKLKASLADTLTLYYPFCGRMKGNDSVECNDEGVIFFEAKFPSKLSEFLKNPQVNVIKEFLPFDPYNSPEAQHHKEPVNMAIQVSEFSCGGIGLGVCISHRIADGTTVAIFLNAWAATARGRLDSNAMSPYQHMAAASIFPPRNLKLDITSGMLGDKNIVTSRFIFSETNLSKLRTKLSGCNPTRVEAVTALIWKSAMESAKAASGEQALRASLMSHAVNIRSRMAPALPENSTGNLWQLAVSSLVDVNREVELNDLAKLVRKTIRKIDAEYLSSLQGDAGFAQAIKSLKEVGIMVSKDGVPCYSFSSWTRFGFYEANFGWGNPTWACTVGVPVKNVVILMPTRFGDGIEGWVTLTEPDMVEFQRNPELLQFASLSS